MHTQVLAGKNVALIAFDIKSHAATAANGPKLLTAVHDHLNYGGVQVNVIFSVGSRSDGAVFDQLIPALGPREGVMVDGENDPSTIYNYFNSRGAAGHIAYGNGSLGLGAGFAPNVLPSIQQASWQRAGQTPAFAIPYAYPVESVTDMEAFITAGADGLIPRRPAARSPERHAGNITELDPGSAPIPACTWQRRPRSAPPGRRLVRPARQDARRLRRRHVPNLTFTLTGCDGTSSVTVDSEYQGQFEQRQRRLRHPAQQGPRQLQSLTLSPTARAALPATRRGHRQRRDQNSAGWENPYGNPRHGLFHASQTVDAGTPQAGAIAGWGTAAGRSQTAASSVNPSVSGQPVTFSATVAPAAARQCRPER